LIPLPRLALSMWIEANTREDEDACMPDAIGLCQ
jgi:hypothetical protein